MQTTRPTRHHVVSLLALLMLFGQATTGCGLGISDQAPPTANAETTDLHPLPVDEGVTAGVLDNGLQYYIEKNQEPRERAVLQLVIKVGSVVEDDDQRGLAHVVEHMAFNGTERFPGNELVKYLESLGLEFGAHLNAHTGFDETVYKLQVPTDDPKHLERAFAVLADWAQGITFDPEEIEKERGVVLEEWRRSRGAHGRARDALLPLTFHASRYEDRDPIGTEESLRTFGRDSLLRFYRDWYRPDLTGVVAVGDFDPERVQELVHRHFSAWRRPDRPRPREYPEIPNHQQTLFGIVADPELPRTAVSLMVKVNDSEGNTEEGYRRMLVENLAILMFNERLTDLAQKRGAPFLAAGVGKQRLTPTEAAYVVGAAAREGEATQALDAILTEIRRIKLHGFRRGELQRAKAKQMRSMEAYFKERTTTDSHTHAAEIIRHFTTGEPMPGIPYEYELTQRLLPKITEQEVLTFTQSWFGAQGRVITTTMPQKERLTVPTEGELRAVVQAVERRDVPPMARSQSIPELLPPPKNTGAITQEKLHEAVGVIEWRLSNGATVFLKPTRFKSDALEFKAFSWGGESLSSEDHIVPAATAAGIATRSGLGDHDLTTLRRILAGKKVRVGWWLADMAEGLHGKASPTELELLLKLAHLAMRQPRLDESGFALHRDHLFQALRNRGANPQAVLRDTHTRLLWQDHPRHRPWTVETLERMSLEHSKEFLLERFANASDFAFFFVGAFDVEAMRSLATRYLATLPSAPNQVETPADFGARRAPGVIRRVIRKGIAPRASVKVTFHGDLEDNGDNRHALQSMTSVLEVLLREKLREDLGGTYSVGVSSSVQSQPVPRYEVRIAFDCDPHRVDELVDQMFTIIAELQNDGVQQGYVQQAREQQRRWYETSLRSNSFWLHSLVSAHRRREPFEEILRFKDRVEALDAEMLRQAAQRYLDPNQYLQVVLLPTERISKRP